MRHGILDIFNMVMAEKGFIDVLRYLPDNSVQRSRLIEFLLFWVISAKTIL